MNNLAVKGLNNYMFIQQRRQFFGNDFINHIYFYTSKCRGSDAQLDDKWVQIETLRLDGQ